MFTGIVEQLGTVARAEWLGGNLQLTVHPDQPWHDLALGESIACNGTCLTVVAWNDLGFQVELSKETVNKTAPVWKTGARLNLERAMPAQGRFGGHVVTGHVDGTGTIIEVDHQPGASLFRVEVPWKAAKYLIPKGSITVDGVSLTVVDVGGPAGSRDDLPVNHFTLWIIPHTLQVTSLGALTVGQQVNLEYDVLAKYLERLTLLGALQEVQA